MTASIHPPTELSAYQRLRRRVHAILEPADQGDRASRIFDICLLILIAANVIAAVIETVQPIGERFAVAFSLFEIISVTIFVIEYVLRLWACRAERRFDRPLLGRLRFAVQPMLIVDLIAFLPALLPMVGVDTRAVRSLRLLRIFRVLKLTRYTQSLQLLATVFRRKSADLVIVTVALLVLLLIAASLMYAAENEAQPELYTSIPSTMWWSIATLTTVGYGDVYPITPFGRMLGGIVMILGIGLFALPAGILASGFTDELQRKHAGPPCPQCGQPTPRQ